MQHKYTPLILIGVMLAGGTALATFFVPEAPGFLTELDEQKWQELQQEAGGTISDSRTIPEGTIVFNDKNYSVDFVTPAQQGADFSGESYEWTTDGESVDNWTSLITTFKLTPLNIDTPLSAEVYSQNVVSLQEENGAFIMETSLINDKNAISAGIDPSNPPFIITYIYPGNETQDAELNIQKIINGDDGTVLVFIYAIREDIITEDDLSAYIDSGAYDSQRFEVIDATFPY